MTEPREKLFQDAPPPSIASRSRASGKRIALAAAASVAVIGGGVIVALLMLVGQPQTISQVFPSETTRPPAGPPGVQNILLLGSDSRGTDLAALDLIRGQRSDTIMLIHIPADRSSITVMSIMRDSWVEIPGYGEAKVNAALSLGGIPLVVETVESLIETRIDHVAVLDFVAFKGITNALGGVKVNNPTAFNSSQLPGRVFESGEIILDGEEALAFVRERYAFSDGDYQRVRNQQLYLKAVISKAIGSDGLTNPARILDIIQAVVPRLATDEGVTPAYAAGLAFELRGIRNKDVKFFTLPTLGTDRVGGQSIVRVDFAELGKVRLALAAETLDEYASQD